MFLLQPYDGVTGCTGNARGAGVSGENRTPGTHSCTAACARAGRGRGGWRGTPQVRPCRLVRRLLAYAILRTRQDLGWASCPTRPTHASGPCGATAPPTPTPPPQKVGRRPWISQDTTLNLHPSIHIPNPKSQIPNPKSRRQARTTQIQPHYRFIAQTLSLTGQETVGGWWGWVAGALHRMDAMAELTGTYLQRAPAAHPHQPSQQNPPVTTPSSGNSSGSGLGLFSFKKK